MWLPIFLYTYRPAKKKFFSSLLEAKQQLKCLQSWSGSNKPQENLSYGCKITLTLPETAESFATACKREHSEAG